MKCDHQSIVILDQMFTVTDHVTITDHVTVTDHVTDHLRIN
jgi:hypothetical protein